MDMKEQNWKNFCANHLRDWHGIWTRYSPLGEMTESFQSLRSFQSNQEHTEITQTNKYAYADGRIEEHSWQYNEQLNSLANGLFHPHRLALRGFFFAQSAAAWAVTQLELGSPFAVELFFKHQDLRHSIGIVYDGSGRLQRTASIREDAANFPSQYWSTELLLSVDRQLSGHWQGTSITMTPDLKVSTAMPTQFHWGWEGHTTFFFPDEISLSCPNQVGVGINFVIAANWLVSSSELQQLIINYDDSGAFSQLTLELFRVSDDS